MTGFGTGFLLPRVQKRFRRALWLKHNVCRQVCLHTCQQVKATTSWVPGRSLAVLEMCIMLFTTDLRHPNSKERLLLEIINDRVNISVYIWHD